MKRLALTLLALGILAGPAHAGTPPEGWQRSGIAWLLSVDRCEGLVTHATLQGAMDSDQRAEVAEQFKAGAASMRLIALSAIAPDSLFAAPLIPPPPEAPPQGQWGNRFIRVSSIVAVSGSLLGIYAGAHDWPPEMRGRIGIVSGAVGGFGALYSLVRPRPAPPPYVDPSERARTTIREMLLRDSFAQTNQMLESFVTEMNLIAASSVETDSARIVLTRRYSAALAQASSLFDLEVPHAQGMAQQCCQYPGFSDPARRRLGELADRLSGVEAGWREWRWLAGRSQRTALAFLGLVERP